MLELELGLELDRELALEFEFDFEIGEIESDLEKGPKPALVLDLFELDLVPGAAGLEIALGVVLKVAFGVTLGAALSLTREMTLELTLIGAAISALVLEPELMVVCSEEIRSVVKMSEWRGTSLGAEICSEGKIPERRGTSIGAGENFPPTGVNLALEMALESGLMLVLDLERVFGPGNIVGDTSATMEESSGSC